MTSRPLPSHWSSNAPLRIIHTDYSRGAVVKLSSDQRSAPVVKYIVQKRRERFEVSRATCDGFLEHCADFATQQEATGYAITECERMLTATGGRDAVRCSP